MTGAPPPKKPALSASLMEALLPPAAVPAAGPVSITINLAAGAVLNISLGAAGQKEA